MPTDISNLLGPKLRVGAWWTIIVLMLLATPIIGTLAGIFILVVAILTLPLLFGPGAIQTITQQLMLVMFFAGFILFALVSALSATNLADMRFVANFLPFILAAPVYLLAKKASGKKATYILFGLCLAGSFIALLVALSDTQIRNLGRAEGYFSGAIIFARNATILGFVAAIGFVVVRSPARYLFLLGPIFAIATTLLSQSRGTLIAIPVLLAMLAYFYLRHTPGKTTRRLMGFSALILMLGLVAFFVSGGAARLATLFEIIPQLLQNGRSGDESVNIRLDFYRTGVELFERSPWIGHGWAKMSDLVYAILNPALYDPLLIEKFHFHNDVLNFAVSGGILGVITYCIFLAAPLMGALRSPKDQYFSARLQILSLLTMLYFISGLTDMVIGYDLSTVMFAMLGALTLGAIRADN